MRVPAPFRTPALSHSTLGWRIPCVAVVVAFLLPSLIGWAIIYLRATPLAGPPKDGTGYLLSQHFDFYVALVSGSILLSWLAAPFAIVGLRACAIYGWAGWGSAILSAWLVGLPAVHVALNGDLTVETRALLPHVLAALATLALVLWAVFWGLMRARLASLPKNASP